MYKYRSEPLNEFKQHHLEIIIPQTLYNLLRTTKTLNQGIFKFELEELTLQEKDDLKNSFRVNGSYIYEGEHKTAIQIQDVVNNYKCLVIKIERKEVVELPGNELSIQITPTELFRVQQLDSKENN